MAHLFFPRNIDINPFLPIEHGNSVDAVATTPHNEKQFATCSHDHTIKIWDGVKMKSTATWKEAHKEGIWSL